MKEKNLLPSTAPCSCFDLKVQTPNAIARMTDFNVRINCKKKERRRKGAYSRQQ